MSTSEGGRVGLTATPAQCCLLSNPDCVRTGRPLRLLRGAVHKNEAGLYGPRDEGSPLMERGPTGPVRTPHRPCDATAGEDRAGERAVVALVAVGLVAVLPRVAHDLPKFWHRVARFPERV
jgi:hypothetical protein